MSSNPVVLDKIRCIVVDDEALIRERFRYAYPLEEHGFEIVGEAEDGEEALELCRQLSPDIVITDVVMPRMNGLELTGQLKQQMPRIKVIILSSFQEFEFARKAVMLGALGYLLKVTSGYQELLEILDQARSDIEADREKMLLSIEERRQLQDSQPLLRKQLILDIRSGTVHSLTRLSGTCDYLHWQKPAPAFALGMVSIDGYSRLSQTFHPKDLTLFKYVMMRMIEELAGQNVSCNVFDWDPQSIGLWILLQEPEWHAEQHKLFYESILHHARKYLPFTVSVRVSAVHPMDASPEAWPAAFGSAFEELEQLNAVLFYHGHGGYHEHDAAYGAGKENAPAPVSPSSPDIPDNPELPDPAERLDGLDDPSHLQRLVHEEYIRPIVRLKPEPQVLLRWMKELTLRWTTSDSHSRSRYLTGTDGIETIHDTEEFLLSLFLWRASESRLSFDQPVQRSEIRKALSYVAHHYQEPISVADVSGYTAISPNYFSHLFKSQTGINFSDYVTRYRIERSKQYLRETDKQVGEIAEQVGIPDYKYFARIFRRLTGKTPSQYREEEGAWKGKK
ncbi:response regulator [Paenibacillus tritici]|uniref:Response regulator n=1 Tax=Paenibacillus tritici TaxID=1873425 RepID=A0ABX2DKV9_9BACL|nr:response regulator [Paenibacillus tritici]NQX45085.1 response regulator [Paenibacillus tritici]